MILYLYQVHFGSNLLFYFHGSTTIRCGNKVHIWLTMVQFSQLNHDNDVMMLFALLCNVLCVINLLLLISGNVINFLLLISINGINFLLADLHERHTESQRGGVGSCYKALFERPKHVICSTFGVRSPYSGSGS